jgi:hypothetical protein
MRLGIIIALLLTGCDQHSAEKASAQKAVADLMKDPSSAQFRNVRVTPTGNVCGEVNAKNGYGAYAGFSRFVWFSDHRAPKVESDGSSSADFDVEREIARSAIAAYCD